MDKALEEWLNVIPGAATGPEARRPAGGVGSARAVETGAAPARRATASPVLLISLLILAACQILMLRQLQPVSGSTALLTALLMACIGLLVSLALIARGGRADSARSPKRPASATQPAVRDAWSEADARVNGDAGDAADSCPSCGILAPLSLWLREHEDTETLWPALDQLLREVLVEWLGAARVRCYEVLAGSDQLRPLSQRQPAGWALKAGDPQPESALPRPGSPSGNETNAWAGSAPYAREGLFSRVIATRSEYFAPRRSPPSPPARPDGDAAEHYEWVFPVERLPAAGQQPAVVGLVAVGSFRGPVPPSRAQRQAVSRLVGMLWNYVDCRTRLHIVGQTDRATGVLTRGDFFVMAQEALRQSYRHNEPAVAAVLSLEGLRGLDDHGLWQQRDALVENVARLVCSRLRSDDVAGRFSDDRFALLLRRLDSGLGRLIIEKLVSAIDEFLASRTCGATPAPIRVRAGLAGSGLREVSLATLLVSAIEAADLARRLDRPVCSDLDPPAGAQPGNGAGRAAQTAATGGADR